MFIVNGITNSSLQSFNMTLPNGNTITMSIYFIQQQFGWFIKSLTYTTFQLSGTRITNSPNILHQYRNLIPFGLACYSKDDREPSHSQDFVSGASTLYILTAAEVAEYTAFLNGN